MKKYIKSYHMFFPGKIFSIVLYLVYPLVVWILLFIERIFIKDKYVILLSAAAIILAIECVLDFFVFSGYAKKDNNRNAYLKTSLKYRQVLKRAFLSDIIRRFLSTALIIFVTAAVFKVPYNISIFILVSANFFIITTLCILRFFDYFVVYYSVTSIMTCLYIIFTMFIFTKDIFIGVSIVMAVLSIFMVLFHTRILFKIIKEEYYD